MGATTAVQQRPFSFVQYNGPVLPSDFAVRRLIRQHAMRDIGVARRGKAGYGKHNLRQMPVFGTSTPGSSFSPEESSDSSIDVPRSVSAEKWTTPPDFDLLVALMPLTGLRLGISTLSHLIPEESRTRAILSIRQPGDRKLLTFIPSRYHHAAPLRHATDAVLSKLRCMISPCEGQQNCDPGTLIHYNRALRSLQGALRSDKECMTAETLCATELLSVFESLNRTNDSDKWRYHVSGAARLIQARGPERFRTEFERSLFLAHVGPTVMDAFLSNTPCFLDTDEWKATMKTAVYEDESLCEEAPLVLGLWNALVGGPALFCEATNLVLSEKRPSREKIEGCIRNLSRSRDGLLKWIMMAQQAANAESEKFLECPYGLTRLQPRFDSSCFTSSYMAHLSLRATYAVCRLIKARLLYALSPTCFPHLEDECQDLSRKILDLKVDMDRHQVGSLAWSMFMAQGTWIARGTVATADIWKCEDNHVGMIEAWKFEQWSRAIERATQPNKNSSSRTYS